MPQGKGTYGSKKGRPPKKPGMKAGKKVPMYKAGSKIPIPPSGPGTSCPRPEEEILLSNNKWIQAGDLKIGDQVVTSKEIQTVTRVDRIEEQERCEVFFEGLEGEESNSIVTSYSHPYYVEGKGFTEVSDLKIGDIIGSLIVKAKKAFDLGPVISLSVDIAETYMLRAGTENNPMPALSHNKTPIRPRVPKKPPTPAARVGGPKRENLGRGRVGMKEGREVPMYQDLVQKKYQVGGIEVPIPFDEELIKKVTKGKIKPTHRRGKREKPATHRRGKREV